GSAGNYRCHRWTKRRLRRRFSFRETLIYSDGTGPGVENDSRGHDKYRSTIGQSGRAEIYD
ncbi:MAG: hypothetical protein ACR2QU_07850, partial [Gammaproteobacteria bacterium]